MGSSASRFRVLELAPPDSLHHHQTAIDRKDLAGDEGGLIAGQEGDRVGDLGGRAEPPERGPAGDLGLERLGQVLGQLGQDEARAPRRCR